MQSAARAEFVPPSEYLAAEAQSDVRHEYLGGVVYAMAGETRDHNTIALNLAAILREKLRAGRCKVYMTGVRVNFLIRTDEYFYYPDVVVTCDARDTDRRAVRYPKLIVEVLSESTERVDRGEKFFAYSSIETVEEYVLVAQDQSEITVFRRRNQWKPETSSAGTFVLESVDLDLSVPDL
jgi:Uma2 family endonuclease